MEQYQNSFNGIHASAGFKSRMIDMMQEMNERSVVRSPQRTANRGMSVKRKALLIAIAAVLLVLSACAAYAIYWSSTQRAKEYSQSEQAVDDRRALAERSADEIIAGSTFYCPVEGSAAMDGLTLSLCSIAYETFDQSEIHVCFDADDAKTGDHSRLSDVDYVLTIDGQDYPAYAKADGSDRALPAVARAGEKASAEYEIWFRLAGREIDTDTAMTLSGKLYQYDEAGNRGNALGEFSLDFVYEEPTEQIEAERERLIAESLEALDEEAKKNMEVLSEQPDETTQLNITQGAFTLQDVAATEDGLLMGTVSQYGYCNDDGVNTHYTLYMDGYEVSGEMLSAIWDEHTEYERIRVDFDYPTTLTSLNRIDWYASVDDLPETVLVALLYDGATSEQTIADPNNPGQDLHYTKTWQDVEILFKIDPRTGEVTLPKDDAERGAWRAETERLASDGRNASFLLNLVDDGQTQNGVTVRLYDMIAMSPARMVTVEWLIDGLSYPWEAESSDIKLYIDGELQEEKPSETEAYQFSQEKAEKRVAQNGGWQTYNNWFEDFTMDMRASDLPDTFTLRVTFDLYDRNESWERVFIGTFDITTTANKSDATPW